MQVGVGGGFRFLSKRQGVRIQGGGWKDAQSTMSPHYESALSAFFVVNILASQSGMLAGSMPERVCAEGGRLTQLRVAR